MTFDDGLTSRTAVRAEDNSRDTRAQGREVEALLLDHIKILVCYLTAPHACKTVNKAAADFFGASREQLEGESLYGILPPEEADAWVTGNLEVFQGKEEKRTEEWRTNARGEKRLLAITRTPTLDDRGNVRFLICTAEDITGRSVADESLRETAARFEALLEALPDMIYFKGVDRRYRLVNRAFEKLVGKDRSEIVGKTADDAFPPDFAAASRRADDDVIRTRQIMLFEQPLIVDGETEIILEAVKFPILDARGQVMGIGGTRRDISKRKAVEQAIVRAKEEWESTFDAVPDLMAIIDERHRIVRLNRAMAEKLGLTFKEAVGRQCYELVHKTNAPPPFCPHARLLRDGKPHSIEVFDEVLGGTFLVSASPIHDAEGKLKGCVHVARDVTERRNAERLVIQTERLKALADLASGAAHNFNNLLQIIVGNAHMALTTLDPEEQSELESDLQAILTSCHFGAEIVRRLQDFARTRPETMVEGATTFDLSDLVEQAVEMSKPWWKSGPTQQGIRIRVTQDLVKSCLVTGKKSELFEVLVNLLKNAVEALPRGGHIAIKTLVQDNHVMLRVRDNGMGIPKDQIRKVFEPFFTTKGSQGSGMGLASSFGIIRAHGGEMYVQSQEEKGTVFTVKLVRATDRAITPVIPVIQGTINWRILIIDDQWPIVELLRQGLHKYGPEVVSALSGSEGLRIFQSVPVDLVICDVSMPGMSGWEVGKRVREICEQRGVRKTPFILLTGWGDRGREQGKLEESGVDAILEKPADLMKLIAVARELIRT